MHFIPEAICFQGPRDLTWPAQRQPFYPYLTETERSDSVDWTGKDRIKTLLSLTVPPVIRSSVIVMSHFLDPA